MDKAASEALLQALRAHRVELETELLGEEPEHPIVELSAELARTQALIMIIIRRLRSFGRKR